MIAWLLANTLTAALFAALVWTVIRFGRPAPGVRHALWLIVLFKLVSPVEFLWSVPVAALPAPPLEDVSTMVDPLTLSPEPVYGLVSEEMIEVPLGENAAPVFVREEFPVVEESTSSKIEAVTVAKPEPDRRWEWWVLFVWMGGGMLTVLRMTRDTWRFGRFARLAKKAPDSLVSEVAIVANGMGLRTPVVRMLAGLASPVMWCVGRPVLLWPADLEKQVSGEGRRAVIAHELAHLRRRDHWVRWLEMLAAVVHWWNPVFWLARRRLRADAELACDQWATTQADRRTYAEALLTVCMFQPRRRPAAAVGVLGEGKRDMQERLTQIMRTTTPSRAAFAAKLCVALFGLAAIPALTLGQAPAKPEPAKPPLLVEADIEMQGILVKTPPEDAELKVLQEQIKALTARMDALRSKQQQEAKEAARIAQANKEIIEAKVLLERQQRELEKRKVFDEHLKANELKSRDAADPKPANVPHEALVARLHDLLAAKAKPEQRLIKAGTNGVKVIGPDGKEIPGVIVVIDGNQLKPSATASQPSANTFYGFTTPVTPPVAQPLPPGAAPTAVAPAVPAKPLTPAAVAPPMLWAQTAPAVPPAQPAPMGVWLNQPHLVTMPSTAGTILLSRATYKLPKEQAASLITLLNGIKNVVMEIKTDGDTLIVTTTPEAQQAIQGFVKMMTGGDKGIYLRLKLGMENTEKPETINITTDRPTTNTLGDKTKNVYWTTIADTEKTTSTIAVPQKTTSGNFILVQPKPGEPATAKPVPAEIRIVPSATVPAQPATPTLKQ
ncbi:M56 family metallopeptidase [Zavarzinella formosa]|uniref:M56 family metallopeptidase n=1 Tax=Zavarzinella formosa TaxID=360055 RepID=UPI0002DD8B17|nr:M56 family metallopeptidase [Zavarzinella formosa]